MNPLDRSLCMIGPFTYVWISFHGYKLFTTCCHAAAKKKEKEIEREEKESWREMTIWGGYD